jgi:hypothetical protein
MKFSFGQIVRIVGVATALIALIVLQKPCSRSVSKFVTSFGEPDAAVRPLDAASDAGGVLLRGDMTAEEREALIKRELEAARDAGVVGGDGGTTPDAAAAGATSPSNAR